MHSGCPKLAFNLGSELLVGKVTLGFLLCRKENKLLLGVRGFLNISACAWADHPALVERWEAKPGKWLCPSFLFPQQSSFSAVSVVEVEKCYSWLSLHSGQLSRRGRFQQWKYDKSFPFMWGDLSPFHTPPQKCSERRVGVPKSFFVQGTTWWMQEEKGMCAYWAKDVLERGVWFSESSWFLVWQRRDGVTWHYHLGCQGNDRNFFRLGPTSANTQIHKPSKDSNKGSEGHKQEASCLMLRPVGGFYSLSWIENCREEEEEEEDDEGG